MKIPSSFIRSNFLWKSMLLGVAAFGLCSASSHAAVYYLRSGVGSTNWGVPSDWNTQVDGLGTAASTMTGNDFIVTSGRTVGTPTGDSTFGGLSLTIDSGGTFNVRNSGTKTISNLITNAGATLSPNTTNMLNSATTTIGGNTNISFIAGSAVSTFNLGILTGSGNITLTLASGASNTLTLNATNASGYTGTIGWGTAGPNIVTLDFSSSLSSGGGLIATSATSRINLDQDVTFTSLTLDGNPLGIGSYTYAFLNATYDTIFVDGGSGSITVVPEPGTAVCFLGGFGALLLARRRIAARNLTE